MGFFGTRGRVYKPIEEIDLSPDSKETYLRANVKAPRLAGLVVKIFAWILESWILGPIVIYILKRDNLIHKLISFAEFEEPPVFLPKYSSEDAVLKEQESQCVEPDLSPSEQVQQAMHCLPLGQETVLSDPASNFHRWTIQDYSRAYSSGITTPLKVAERFIAMVKESTTGSVEMSFFINHYVEDILRQATESTLRYERGKPISVLDGVPIAVKDEIDCMPYPTTGGTKWLHRLRPCEDDACCVLRLRSCGALLVGKTNMHELGAGTSGINPHYGATRNPYDTGKVAGGSSSGSAAVVSAGLCPVALGVDGGGSVRMPAALCGVVGFKPTFGRISHSGVVPLNWTVGMVGILAGTVEDAFIAYAAISGHLPSDQSISLMPRVSFPVLTSTSSISNLLLSSKILLAIDLALDCKDAQADLWDRISRDEYMAYAVKECYYSIEKILHSLVVEEGRLWVERLFHMIDDSVKEGSILVNLQLKKLPLVVSRFTGLTGLIRNETPELARGAAKAMYDLYEVVTHELLSSSLREEFDTWYILARPRNEGRLFSRIEWPKEPEIKEQIKRLHLLLSVKDSAANIPKNLEARRRLEFFTNSLFMDMPSAKLVRQMIPFCVFTPYYSETVLYSSSELRSENEDGISTLFYLQKIFPDEWDNFLERIGRGQSTGDADLQESSSDALELRFWASYRGQTLARTVRGMMYYRRALMLQSYLERRASGDIEGGYSAVDHTSTQGYELSPESRAQADLKFTYVVSCQIYGQQKQKKAPEAADIALLLQRNEALRVAFIHVEENIKADGKVSKEFYSKLVKADIHGKDQEIYSIKLPGDPKLGEGKPENQNHAIIFTRGEAVQTIDMNQDNYLEEAMKMRNLLEEFRGNHGIRPPTILGVREHVFTGSVSSLAWFMSNQETSFVTLGQRVLAYPLKVRMHYGHPDVFDRIFHISRGGISKASRVINISEDIFAGFNSTLRQGNITHHEYIQVGKGRDVGLNQIALFEGKVAGGNGEQVLSRDVYRLGQLFDFFRMLSFFFTTVGYYVCTMMTVLTVYIFLYGRVYLALSGLDRGISQEARLLGNTALDAALNAQFLVQIGVFTAVPMIMGFILELGLLKAVFSFITMQLQLCSVFFTFSLGTRTHYFGRTILHGGAKYKATGRGFVVQHIKFAENYRLYSRSHFVKALEVALLLIVYIAYGYTRGGATSFILLTISSWFLVISWLFAPYIFNPSGFEWQKTVEDFDNWTGWLLYKGGVGVKGENSWESWWDEEQMHIQTTRGRILETILSFRFVIFQYGIVYKLHLTGKDTSLAIYGFSWVVLVGFVMIFKVFTFSPKKSTNFQLMMRFIQGVIALTLIAAIVLFVALTDLSITDLFASVLAFIPTGWAILCLAITWKGLVKTLGMWESVREFARLYDAGMGMIIFAPIAFLSWFPFVSTFQSRLLFNQAFSRGLEISLILAGNKANVQA